MNDGWLSRGWVWLRQLPVALLILLTRAYQIGISPWFGGHCRFTPTCSQYMIDCLRKYGAIRGTWKGMKRILKCHPFHPGVHDPA